MAKTILTISGTDGSGKGTVSQEIQLALGARSIDSYVISPPFYDSPIGSQVGEYLKSGYGCWQNRKMASAVYSMDRNWWMREHFNEVFVEDTYDVAIYNRNWIDSLLYQTTLIAQTPNDTATLRDTRAHYLVDSNLPSRYAASMSSLHDVFDEGRTIQLLPSDDPLMSMTNEAISRLNPTEKETLHQFYVYNRIANIRDHLSFLYELEVEPYQLPSREYSPTGYTQNMVPFTSACRMINIVLCPHVKHAKDIITANLLERYKGDTSKMDRNENNLYYQAAVVENIEWIQSHWPLIMHANSLNMADSGLPALLNSSWRRNDMVNKGVLKPLPLDAYHAFEYRIIYITRDDGSLRKVSDIAADVMKILDAQN